MGREIVVYILDQVRALEEELLHKIELQVLDVKPQILMNCLNCSALHPVFNILTLLVSHTK
ncbi:hypothetical protein JHK82_055701 [Glycine max]|nr:hypothetical protein JHK82_055701 [Glycine max]